MACWVTAWSLSSLPWVQGDWLGSGKGLLVCWDKQSWMWLEQPFYVPWVSVSGVGRQPSSWSIWRWWGGRGVTQWGMEEWAKEQLVFPKNCAIRNLNPILHQPASFFRSLKTGKCTWEAEQTVVKLKDLQLLPWMAMKVLCEHVLRRMIFASNRGLNDFLSCWLWGSFSEVIASLWDKAPMSSYKEEIAQETAQLPNAGTERVTC